METAARNLLKTALFTAIVPATVAGLVPYLLLPPAALGTPPSPTPLKIVAGVLGFLGLALYVRCALGFALEGRGTPAPVDPPRRLVARGPYRRTRNPMYIAVLAVVLAEALYFASGRLAIYAALLFLAFHLFVRFCEEPTLGRRFGEDYSWYMESVPRWFPRLGRLGGRNHSKGTRP